MVLTCFSLLMPAFALPRTPACLTARLPRPWNAPLPATFPGNSRVSVGDLSPASFSAPPRSTSELLRTLSRMAASGPTSWLSPHADLVLHLATAQGPQPRVRALSLSTMKLISHGPTATRPLPVFGVCQGSVSVAPPPPYSALPPTGSHVTPAPKLFRGEQAISRFVWHFTPTHKSSQPFATDPGSALPRVLPRFQPVHA